MKIFGAALLFVAISNAQAVPFVDPDEPEEKAETREGGAEPEIAEHGTGEKIEESGDKTAAKGDDEPAKEEEEEKHIEEKPVEKEEDEGEPVEITAEEAEE